MDIIKECKDGNEMYRRFRKMLNKGERLRIARTFYVRSLDEKCGPRQRRGDTLFYPVVYQGFTVYPFKSVLSRELKSIKISKDMYETIHSQVPYAAILSIGHGPKLCNLLKRLDDLGASISFTVSAVSYSPRVKWRELYHYDSSTIEDKKHVRKYYDAVDKFKKLLEQSKAQS